MDPYLERHWEDVHHSLIQYARDTLQPQLPDDLWARVEERVFVESESERSRRIVPDVHISRVYPSPKHPPTALREGELALAEPLVFDLHEPLSTEGFIEIRERTGGKLVTVIEFLSVANKSGGAGQEKFLQKQAEVLRSDASLVEVDLVRAGQRVLALPSGEIPAQHRGDYLVCISPGWKRNRRELYPMPLRQRLPILPMPLRQPEPRVNLDLQALVDQAYATGRYDRLDYSTEPDPAWTEGDAGWARTLLEAAGRR